MSNAISSVDCRSFIAALMVLAAGGCASSHDFGQDSFSPTGGGFYNEELKPGLHYIVAKTTVAPWRNVEAARRMWTDRANHLCKGPYQELEVREVVEEPLKPVRPLGIIEMPYLVTVRKGYALCDYSAISIKDASKMLQLGPVPR